MALCALSLCLVACDTVPSPTGDSPLDLRDNSSPWADPAERAPSGDASENAPPSTGETAQMDPAQTPSPQQGQLPLPTPDPQTPATQAPIVPVPNAPASFAELVTMVQPSVVNIYTEYVTRRRQLAIDPLYGPYAYERPQHATSLGSGFIIDNDGYILTNTHVVEGASSVKISTSDGREFPAAVVGTDPQTDIALLKIEPFPGMVPLPMGSADDVRVGDWLMAVGNPFGLQSTVTVGILSARGRRNVPLQGEIRYMDFLQTDASINPGNSGGPLIDMKGRAVGINTAINAQGQGIGFAIPIDMARTVLDQLRTTGAVSRAWLGVQLASVPNASAEGALITQVVVGGPSAVAGMKPGDVIVSFDGKPVRSADELPWLASNAGIGETVTVAILREGARYDVDVVMGALPY